MRHADARSVAVRLDWNDDDLTVTVTDDGRCPGRRVGGRGLIGIQSGLPPAVAKQRRAPHPVAASWSERVCRTFNGHPRLAVPSRWCGSDPPATRPGPVRVALADVQELVRSGFAMILGAQPDIDVVADVGGGAAAMEAVRQVGIPRGHLGHPDATCGRHRGRNGRVRRVGLPGDRADHTRSGRVCLRRAVRRSQRLACSSAPGATSWSTRFVWWRPASRCSHHQSPAD